MHACLRARPLAPGGASGRTHIRCCTDGALMQGVEIATGRRNSPTDSMSRPWTLVPCLCQPCLLWNCRMATVLTGTWRGRLGGGGGALEDRHNVGVAVEAEHNDGDGKQRLEVEYKQPHLPPGRLLGVEDLRHPRTPRAPISRPSPPAVTGNQRPRAPRTRSHDGLRLQVRCWAQQCGSPLQSGGAQQGWSRAPDEHSVLIDTQP